MNTFRKTVLCTFLAAAGVLATGAAQAGPMRWISLGESAYQILRQNNARIGQVEPAAVVADRSEKVYLLQVDEEALPALSQKVHEQLHRCGGYMFHDTRELGLKRLAGLQRHASATGQSAVAAAAPSYVIDNQATVNALLPLVQESQILANIQTLSANQNRYYNSSAGVTASNNLAKAWKRLAAGRSDVTVQQVAHSWPQKSVVMTIQGSTAPDEVIVIGGHLDSITTAIVKGNSRSPGADDDASGIASLQEVARVLLANNYKPKRTLQFMAYAAEEVGLRGSAAIADSYAAASRKVVGVLQLDMTNYQGAASDITLISDYTNAAQNTFVANLASTYLPTLTVTSSPCGYACSDHASWTANGYAASFPFEAPLGEDNPHIHTKGDTLDKSGNSAAHALKFSRLALAYAVELASDAPTAARSSR